jgi:hypothetical protein
VEKVMRVLAPHDETELSVGPNSDEIETQFKRAARRYRTGRNVQFNVKALKETVDAFYAVSEAQGWVLGYTLQRAIEALQSELKNPK